MNREPFNRIGFAVYTQEDESETKNIPVWSCLRRFWIRNIIKMTSAQNSSNNGKIKLPTKPLSMVIFWIKLRRSYRDLSSQADPARENWTWNQYPYFSLNGRFPLVENRITLVLRILARFDIKFLEPDAWEFYRGVT